MFLTKPLILFIYKTMLLINYYKGSMAINLAGLHHKCF